MTTRRFARLYLVVLALAALPGVVLFLPGAHATVAPGVQAEAAAAAAGRPLYEEHCASCHGEQAQGTNNGPSLVGLGPAYYDFMMSTGRMPLDFPAQAAVRRPPVLTPSEIHDITAYLTSLAPGQGIPIPNVPIGKGDLAEGEQLYQLNCAPCHGTTGNGGAVGPRYAPNLHQATPQQIVEAIRIGPTTMPKFSYAQMPWNQAVSLARYVMYLRDPEDKGGAGLSHVGPLIEGFVAILVGLGLIVVLTRFLGERS
jgi:ubiquinol-cytochrome c reductase cytochrome c subunit